MDWFYRGISILLILFTVNYFLKLNRKTTNDNEDVIYLPYKLKSIGIGFILTGSLMVLLLSIFMSDSMDKLYAILFFFAYIIFGVLFTWIDFRYRVFIHKSKLTKRTFFSSREIPYDSICYKVDGNNIIIEYKDKKFYINFGYPNTMSLYETINKYFSQNKIENKYDNQIVSGNFYSKNFGITFIIIGLFSIALSIIIFLFSESTGEIIFGYIFMVIMGFTPFIIGVLFLLLYRNFSIKGSLKDLIYTNIFKREKIYRLEELSLRSTPNGFKVYVKNKRIFYINYWFYNNTDFIENLLIKKRKNR
ncbi:MAG: hypothetical protein NUK62_08915 [Tenericutes bacterium]|nr:hypothetical protein [Mycoplasmatota bacterium]